MYRKFAQIIDIKCLQKNVQEQQNCLRKKFSVSNLKYLLTRLLLLFFPIHYLIPKSKNCCTEFHHTSLYKNLSIHAHIYYFHLHSNHCLQLGK